MARALKIVVPSWYILDDDKDQERPTRWQVKPLTPPEKESCMSINEEGWLCIAIKDYDKVLKTGLVGWENFFDDDEKEIPFSKLYMHRIALADRLELAGEILRVTNLSEAAVKN